MDKNYLAHTEFNKLISAFKNAKKDNVSILDNKYNNDVYPENYGGAFYDSKSEKLNICITLKTDNYQHYIKNKNIVEYHEVKYSLTQLILILLCSIVLCACSDSSSASDVNEGKSSLVGIDREISIDQAEAEPDREHLEYVYAKILKLSQEIDITDISDHITYIEVTVPDETNLKALEDTLLADKTDMDGIMIHTQYPLLEDIEKQDNTDDVLSRLNELSKGIKVIKAVEHSAYAEIIVYDHNDVKALEDIIQKSGYQMNGIMIHVSYDFIVPKPNLSGIKITDIETIEELISKYKKYFHDPRIYEKNGIIFVELNWETDIETLKQYLESSDVDMSIVELVKPERYNT